MYTLNLCMTVPFFVQVLFVQGEEEELPKRHAVSIRVFGVPAGETGTLQGTLSPHCQRNVKTEFQECAPMSWRELTVSVVHMCSAAPVLAFATHSAPALNPGWAVWRGNYDKDLSPETSFQPIALQEWISYKLGKSHDWSDGLSGCWEMRRSLANLSLCDCETRY